MRYRKQEEAERPVERLRRPTLVKSLHHCQLRSLRYAAQFLWRTFMAVSCCCLLAKALETKGPVSHSGMRKAHILTTLAHRSLHTQ